MASNKNGEKTVKFVSVFLLAILVISCILSVISAFQYYTMARPYIEAK